MAAGGIGGNGGGAGWGQRRWIMKFFLSRTRRQTFKRSVIELLLCSTCQTELDYMTKEDRNSWRLGHVVRGGFHVPMIATIRHKLIGERNSTDNIINYNFTLTNSKAPFHIRHELQENRSSHVCNIQPVLGAVPMVRHDDLMGISPKLRQAPGQLLVFVFDLNDLPQNFNSKTFLVWNLTVPKSSSESEWIKLKTCIPTKNSWHKSESNVCHHCHSVSQLLSNYLNLFDLSLTWLVNRLLYSQQASSTFPFQAKSPSLPLLQEVMPNVQVLHEVPRWNLHDSDHLDPSSLSRKICAMSPGFWKVCYYSAC